MTLFLSLFSAGFLSSFIGGLMGLGGGVILVPFLTLVFHFNIKDAIFFSLCAMCLLSFQMSLQSRALLQEKRVILKKLLWITLLGSSLAAFIGTRTPPAMLQFLFGAFMITVGLFYLFERQKSILPTTHKPIPLTGFFIFLSSLLGGFFGIGGGIINVPVFNKVLCLSMFEATRLSFVFVFFSTAIALLVFFHQRKEAIYELSFLSLLILLYGTFLGAYCSGRIKLSEKNIKKLFAAVLLITGVIKILKTIPF